MITCKANATIDVLGLGVSTVDILSLVSEFPAAEGVQQAAATVLDGGGPVATALVAVARLGGSAAMLDSVGDDWRSDLIRGGFTAEGIDTGLMKITPGCTASVAMVLVRRGDGARAIVYSPGTAPELIAADVPESAVAQAKILHLNGRHLDACKQACRYAKIHNTLISFDGGANRYRPEVDYLLAQTDIGIVARQFAVQATGQPNVELAGRALLALGMQLAVITGGADGSWVFTAAGDSFHQAAFPAPVVVDTTGCGDAYHGAFLSGIVRGWDLPQTAALASKVAAINAATLGGRRGLVNSH